MGGMVTATEVSGPVMGRAGMVTGVVRPAMGGASVGQTRNRRAR
jgi:hypothetical protein